MSAPHPPICSPPSELREESPPEYTDVPPTDNTPQVRMNEESRVSVEIVDLNVESKMRKICKMMCVTTNSALMVIMWTIASMYFSGLSAYWLSATWPVYRFYEYLILFFYPMSAALVVVLLLSPVFAVVGDVLCGNYILLLSGVIPLNVFGLVVLIVLAVTFGFVQNDIISYFFVVGFLFLFLAGGIFQANAIQFGRDVLGDFDSLERSAFVHWYYWATYVPTFSVAIVSCATYFTMSMPVTVVLVVMVGLAIFALLIFLLVTCVVHCLNLITRGWNTVLPRITENPITQIFRVCRYALRSRASLGHSGCLVKLNKIRRSNGGPADDGEVDNVGDFWLIVLLMVSLYGFFFWDDMWAVPFANALIVNDNPPVIWGLSSQAVTSVIVFICVPIYQLAIRPIMGKCSISLLWRILAGLILQLISLPIVTWSAEATKSQLGSEVYFNVCTAIVDDDYSTNTFVTDGGVGWFILVIPQVINGFSQLLVFPAVIELILKDAPRAMQGLLIGLWYAMQSIHVIVSVIETATCAVFYWQYYIMKIVLVLISVISFSIIAYLYKHRQVMCNGHVTRAQDEVGIYLQLKESNSTEDI